MDSTDVHNGPVQSIDGRRNKLSALKRRGKTVNKLGVVELQGLYLAHFLQ